MVLNCLKNNAPAPSTEPEKAMMTQAPFPSLVGSIMFAMVCTRIAIAQAPGIVSKYMANWGQNHWNATKWIFCYLKGTLNTTWIVASPN